MPTKRFSPKLSTLLVGLTTLLVVGCSGGGLSSSSSSSSSSMSSISSSSTYTVQQLATVRGKVLLDNGEMMTAGIIVQDAQGNTFRARTNELSAYNIRLQPGTYTLTFTRGHEFSTVTKTLTVEMYKTYYVQDVRLVHLEDAYAKGWVAGDLHQHSYYSDGVNSVPEVLVSNVSTGLYYGFLSDHNTGMGLAEWTQGNRMEAYLDGQGNARMFGAYDAVEVTTEYGHYQSLGVGLTFDTYEVTLRDIERILPADQKRALIVERIRYIGDTITRAGGVAQINHPYSSSTMGFTYWEAADAYDTIEIWNGVFAPGDGRYEPDNPTEQGQNYRSKLKWFELLNSIRDGGKFFAAAGGTDNHDVSGSYTANPNFTEIETRDDYEEWYQQSGRYSGVPTTYVNIDGEVTQEKVLNALRNGHSFVTNGPLVYGSIAGATYGETALLSSSSATLQLEGFARDGWEGLRIVKNGEVLQTLPAPNTSNLQESLSLTGLQDGDWIVIEALGKDVQYAITNPIFISIDA